ncbi:MAG: alpha/beta fold hydrolase [Actinomyces sp.]|nr:alpha/beta fold hydrolase [Actinomyces sp.]
MKNVKLLATVGAITLLLSACSTTPQARVPEETVQIEAPEPALQTFYDQRAGWQNCDGDASVMDFTDGRAAEKEFKCAKVTVPLEYENPGNGTIELQLVKYSKSAGAEPLVFNPGGPGGSAVSSLPSMVDYTFTEKLMAGYDIVAVDPRGVGLSAPVRCLTAEETDEFRAEDAPATVEEIREASRKLGQACLEKSPEMARHSDSESAMRDMDIVRAALGQEKLDYMGFSYGTFLGALYADTFPQQVGRFVLDGALDPSIPVDEVAEGQASGFENILAFWLDAGSKKGQIPLKGNTDQMKEQLGEWLETLEDEPLPTADSNRPLTKALATSAILALMYDDSTWNVAWAGLSQAMSQKDGSILLQVADLYADRQDDGSYKTNSFDAFTVINSLDYKALDDEQMQVYADRILRNSPLLGEGFIYSSASIEGWPVESRDTRREVKASGADPILVIGTTFDPATPYYWAESLAKQLESGHLLKVEGLKHTAYSRKAGNCVTDSVDDFMLAGKVPDEGKTCQLPKQ